MGLRRSYAVAANTVWPVIAKNYAKSTRSYDEKTVFTRIYDEKIAFTRRYAIPGREILKSDLIESRRISHLIR